MATGTTNSHLTSHGQRHSCGEGSPSKASGYGNCSTMRSPSKRHDAVQPNGGDAGVLAVVGVSNLARSATRAGDV